MLNLLFFISYAFALMIVQGALIDAETCARRDVAWNSIKASFTQVQQSNYEVLLEVSSNKFLVNMVTDGAGMIQGLEIVAVKGFMELSKKVIEVVRNLISHMWEMCD